MRMNYLHKFIGTAGGLGYAPFAPGTFGSLGGLLSGWAIFQYTNHPFVYLSVLIVIFLFWGVYSANQLISEWGEDPSRIVIDEVVGMWISMLFLPNHIAILFASFVCFRLFDIYKPLGIRKFENLTDGWGIMMDDVAAGCFANIALQIILILYKQFL